MRGDSGPRIDELAKWLKKLSRKIPKGSEFLSDKDGSGRTSLEEWAEYLQQYPAEVLIAIVPTLIKKCDFFPSLAEIDREADLVMGTESEIPTKAEAYDEVFALIFKYGTYGAEPEYSHPAIRETVRGIGGYKRLALSENMTADRARFFEIYEACSRRHRQYEEMPAITRKVAGKYLREIEQRTGRRIGILSFEERAQLKADEAAEQLESDTTNRKKRRGRG